MKDELSINIYLDETDTPFSRYYSSEDVHLSSDLEDFILSKLHSGKRKEVEIFFLGQNDFDEKSLKTATFNTFSNFLNEEEYTYVRNVKKAIVLFVLGIIVGVIFLKLSSNHAYIAGVLSIVSWVFIWAGTEVYFFENQQIKRNIRKCKNILEANVHKK
ncbi:hypothetical protein CON65_16480 [Bacillus pseudomycoides]|uniref:Uncharacterized protein n=1 Tax=Bacillus pseudomycoides TaxID=64104 RepID=A0AA91VC96_9BACI|nr:MULTISPECIES: hypothetical protein [Bacillus]PEB48652.1 hypothetical protein COO03_24255 [Bacillus sp. AFS098217]PED81605.1 hypothetical protein CON65_16480 [Bacillus pseudomycoides]PEU05488.1 hypothetical protein CN524_25610 [Bacillus sp. AFS019443]PEU08402.1 hypothetical protein CN525_25900 [Bacillus sp. AFS014408]PFW62248.1 hypothetical protein COL20_14130 [Bacillus sp. AFS075034]